MRTIQKFWFILQKLRDVFGFKEIRETTLGGNQWKNEAERFNWVSASDVELTERELSLQITNYRNQDETIVFQPMEIKTFILYY